MQGRYLHRPPVIGFSELMLIDLNLLFSVSRIEPNLDAMLPDYPIDPASSCPKSSAAQVFKI